MISLIKERVIQEAYYMIKTNDTLRRIAIKFNVSKSTVHKDLHERLLYIDKELFDKVNSILQYHMDIRHIRGGKSKKKKYEKMA